MSHEAGGDEIALRRRHPPTAAPLDDEDLLGEILLRVPPLPSSLLRTSLVSKLCGGVATAPSFSHRFVAHHRRPPVLGFFEKGDGELVFTPILDPLASVTSPPILQSVSGTNLQALRSKFVLNIFFNVAKSIAWCSSSLCLLSNSNF
uniref:F-box domain-containing protein n=1 Tax=Triticum urartu TaxID=4572 RepID=A0A8R7PDM7_TRIUA